MLIFLSWWFLFFWTAKGLVLDPSLYLSPSPPLTSTQEETSWSQPRTERSVELEVIPIESIKTTESVESTTIRPIIAATPTTTEKPKIMKKTDKLITFLRTSKPSISPYLGIHVPLTFSLTGTYGRYGTGLGNIGVIGSSYGSISDVEGDPAFSQLYGKSGLAGSSYGAYGGYGGTRIYGTSAGAAWSGWGNGQWGHYGKG